MNTSNEGWWIDLETGEAILIYDHRQAVVANPERYRVKPGEIAGCSRSEILRMVFKRGFMRVRDNRGEVHFEFDAARDLAMRRIRQFLKLKYGVASVEGELRLPGRQVHESVVLAIHDSTRGARAPQAAGDDVTRTEKAK